MRAKTIPHGSNNIGEFWGLVLVLQMAIELGVKKISVFGDSEILVKAVNER